MKNKQVKQVSTLKTKCNGFSTGFVILRYFSDYLQNELVRSGTKARELEWPKLDFRLK